MDKNELLRILDEQKLPTLPEVIGRIQEAYEREKTNATEMAAILESDHAIANRILKLANSAYYGVQSEVASVPRAVVVLGFTVVRDLALTTAVFDTFAGRTSIALDPEEFWMHSLGTAKAAHLVARKHCPQTSAEGCFTIGLIHDMGKFLLALAFPEQYREILDEARSTEASLIRVERSKLGTDHAEAGSLMAQRWKLPEMFSEVIGNLPMRSKYLGRYCNELRAIAIGHDIARSAGFGGDGTTEAPVPDRDLLDPLGLNKESVEELEKEIRAYWDMAVQFFHILQGA